MGTKEVIVPYATALARMVPTNVVRMTRDFKKLIAAIQAHALLHQFQREHSSDGRLIATLHDYAVVRELMAELFDATVAEGLTETRRATVENVPDVGEISLADLARLLGVSRNATHVRVQACIKAGWLVNHESRLGHPPRLSRGTPLLRVRGGLPTVEEVSQYTSLGKGDYTSPLPSELIDDDIEWNDVPA